MTTTLDIIDTAVKIGLGALISGVATYVLAKNSFKQDLSKSILADKLSILKESAIQVETATNVINHACHYLCFNTENNNDSDARIKSIVDAYNNLGSASAKCNMIGKTELANILGEYENLAHKFYSYFNSNNNNIDVNEVNLITNKMSECQNKTLKLFQKAYENINA